MASSTHAAKRRIDVEKVSTLLWEAGAVLLALLAFYWIENHLFGKTNEFGGVEPQGVFEQ